MTVNVQPVTFQNLSENLATIGMFAPHKELKLLSEVQGKVIQVGVEEGNVVQPGWVLIGGLTSSTLLTLMPVVYLLVDSVKARVSKLARSPFQSTGQAGVRRRITAQKFVQLNIVVQLFP